MCARGGGDGVGAPDVPGREDEADVADVAANRGQGVEEMLLLRRVRARAGDEGAAEACRPFRRKRPASRRSVPLQIAGEFDAAGLGSGGDETSDIGRRLDAEPRRSRENAAEEGPHDAVAPRLAVRQVAARNRNRDRSPACGVEEPWPELGLDDDRHLGFESRQPPLHRGRTVPGKVRDPGDAVRIRGLRVSHQH